jgi:hypothetical protein
MSIYDKSSLVLIPSGTKTGKVYSQKPVSGDGDFTFTRSSAATRVNADGNIEKETQNLLLQSNTFDTTWGATGITMTSGQAGYDGTNNAWLMTKTAAAYRQISQGVSGTGVRTLSVYAKAGTLDVVTLFYRNGGGNDTAQKFNLTSGTLAGTGGITNFIHSSIQDVGGGWYRCSLTYDHISGSTIRIYPDFAETDAGNIYIQDAQLEQGLVARDYIETTTAAVEGGITDNVPRLDYTDSSCPALLLEPQRTNGLHYSEYFDSYFDADGQYDNITITHNATASPEGLQNATKLAGNSTSNNPSTAYIGKASAVSSQPYVSSVFAKAGEYDYIILTIGSYTSGFWASFNLDSGEVDTDPTAANTTASIEDYGDGWYRCMIHTTNTGGAEGVYFSPSVDGTRTTNYTNTTNGVYIYGAQVEAGSYATSYIPTYGSSVTRVYENQDATGLSSSVFNNDNLTIFYDFNYNAEGREGSTTAYRIFSSSSQLGIKGTSNTARSLQIYSSGDFSGTINFNGAEATRIKVALRITDGTCELFFNGAKDTETIDVSAGAPYTWGQVTMLAGSSINTSLNQCLGFPTALTDQELIDLTTL